MNTRLLIPVVASAALMGVPLSADDAAVEGVGGVIELLDEHPSVVMEKMDVVVDLGNAEADVDCTFVFYNSGAALDVRMGFPEEGGGVDVDVSKPHGFRSFASWVDGKEVPTTIEGFETRNEREWKRWRVKTVHFAEGQRRVVRVRYPANFGYMSTGEMFFHYHVHTGASWKRPIGWGRICLKLKQDPGRGRYAVGAPFQQCGPRCYEWVRRDFEPEWADDVNLVYVPYYDGIRSHRDSYRARHAAWPARPYIEDGMLWLPVQIAAAEAGGDLSLNGGDAVIVRGTRRVELHPLSDLMNTEAGPKRLPRPTRVEHERLVVPAAAVLRAFGIEVTYQAEDNTVHIRWAEAALLEGVLGAEQAGRAVVAMPPGWVPPDMSEYEPELLEYLAANSPGPPWLCAGDFDGDGHQDIALRLRKENESGIWIVRGRVERGTGLKRHWLKEPREVGRPEAGARLDYLRTRPPGVVAYWQEGEPIPKSGRLDLPYDGVEVIIWGKAAVLHYRDESSGEWQSVITAD